MRLRPATRGGNEAEDNLIADKDWREGVMEDLDKENSDK
jgi:hypothetical protein